MPRIARKLNTQIYYRLTHGFMFDNLKQNRDYLNSIYEYIQNQRDHHKKQTFKEEYLEMLKKFDIEYKEEHLFEFFD